MGADLDQQRAGGQVLVIFAVAEKDRPGQGGVAAFDGVLHPGGEAEVFAPVGHIHRAVVAAGNDHQLGGLAAVDLGHRLDQGGVPLHRVPVDVQHHLDAGVLFQIVLDSDGAALVGAVVGGVVVLGSSLFLFASYHYFIRLLEDSYKQHAGING